MSTRSLPAVVLWASLALLLGASVASAAGPPGSLDRSFGHRGVVFTGLGEHADANKHWTKQIVVAPDRKILFGTGSPRGGFTVERLNPDGTLDATFGGDGSVAAGINGESIAVQPNGRVLVAGSIGEGDPGRDFAVMRYLPDGGIDRTFGQGGLVRFRKGLEDGVEAVGLQPDGTIVLAGRSYCDEGEPGCGYYERSVIVLMRLRPDGGLVSRSRYKGRDFVISLAVGDRGQTMVVAGSYRRGQSTALLRFSGEGELLTDFGKAGAVAIETTSDTGVLSLQPDDKPVLAGFGVPGGGIRRLEPDGTPDASFGNAGTVECAPSVPEYPSPGPASVAVLPDGRLLAAGGRSDCGLVRYLPDGSADASFGIGGRVGVISALGGSAESLAAGPDNTAVVIRWQAGAGFLLARYLVDGSLDPTFGVGGVATVPARAATFDQANALLALEKGKLLAVGTSTCADHSCGEFALARYRADGRLDASFGHGGLTRSPLDGFGLATSAAIQRNGGIVVGGAIGIRDHGETKHKRLALARYTPNGAPDTGFGERGVVTVPSAPGEDVQINAVAIARGGDVLAAGEAECEDSSECGERYCSECASFVVARFRPDGSPVRDFGSDGVLRLDVGHSREDHDAARAIAVQPDGKILVAGRTYLGGFGLVRLLPDGKRDRSFGSRGVTRTYFSVRLRDDDGEPFQIGVHRPATSMALLRGGKIVVAGGVEAMRGFPSENPRNRGSIVRYRPDGRIDTSFGDDGVASADGLAIKALAIDRCGRLVLAGAFSRNPGVAHFGVTRRLPSGRPDPSFSRRIVHLSLGTSEDSRANAVALSRGKIISAGVAANAGAGDDFALAALRAGRGCNR